MKVMKEKLSKLMYLLGWHPDGKPTKVSYITFLISLCMIGSLDCILEISVKKIIILLTGVLAIVIVRKLIREYYLKLFLSSGIIIAVITFLSAFVERSFTSAIGDGSMFFSWWGFFLYLPMFLWLLKISLLSFMGFFSHKDEVFKCLKVSIDAFPGSDAYYTKCDLRPVGFIETIGAIKHTILCIGYLIMCVIALFVVVYFFNIGMYSLMVIRAVAEFIRIMDKWMPEKTVTQ